MKVLVAHNRYRSDLPSGENQVVDSEIAMLERAGVAVVPYLRSSDEITQMPVREKLRVPLAPIRSARSADEVRVLIRRHRPDLLHLHNPYPLISLGVVSAAHDLGLPVVQTVHNHRHSCMRGSYFRAGHPCQLCRGRALPWPGVVHGCYRDSRVQSVPMAVAFLTHRRDQRAIDRYVALSRQIADSLLASGLVRPDQVTVRPNSVPDPGPPTPVGRELLFVGRFTREKGLDRLLDAWRQTPGADRLTLVGDGPLMPQAAALAQQDHRVQVLGQLDRGGVQEALRRSAFAVVPSTSPEGMPLVVLEAFAAGRPVLATAGGGLEEAVDDRVGRTVAATVDGLADGLRRMSSSDLQALGTAARARYETTYSPEVVVRAQLAVYRAVLDSCAR